MDLVHILSPEDIEDPHATLQNKWGVESNFELFIVIALFHDRLCSCIAVQPDHVQGLGLRCHNHSGQNKNGWL